MLEAGVVLGICYGLIVCTILEVVCATGVLVFRMPALFSACGRFYIFDLFCAVVALGVIIVVGGFVTVDFCIGCDLYVFYRYYCRIVFCN
jgi:hypothetical protein